MNTDPAPETISAPDAQPPNPLEESFAKLIEPVAAQFTAKSIADLREIFLATDETTRALIADVLRGAKPPVPTKKDDTAAQELQKKLAGRLDGTASGALVQILAQDKDTAAKVAEALQTLPDGRSLEAAYPRPLPPPRPLHDPEGKWRGNEASDDAREKVRLQNELVVTIQGEGRFTTFSEAWNEARRRRPALFN